MKKFFITLFSLILVSFIIFVVVINAQTTQISSKILYNNTRSLSTINDQGKIIKIGDFIYYSILGNEIDSINIIFSGENKYSNKEKVGDKIKIYSSDKYFKNDNGQVQEIITEKVSPAEFEKFNNNLLSFLTIPYVNAYDFLGYRDRCYLGLSSSSFSEARDKTTADDTIGVLLATADNDGGGNYFVARSFLSFDLTGIGTINSASIFMHPYNDVLGSGLYGQSFGFTESNYSDPDNYDSYSQINDTITTNIIDDTDIHIGYNEFILNSTGLAYLTSGINAFSFREINYDVASTTPPVMAIPDFYFFSPSGLYEEEPYMLISVSGTSTPTIIPAGASGDDIGVVYYNATTTLINATTSITSATYNIPFFLFKFVSIIMTVCLLIIITFFLSFLKKNRKL
jgi:hypothetical protein